MALVDSDVEDFSIGSSVDTLLGRASLVDRPNVADVRKLEIVAFIYG